MYNIRRFCGLDEKICGQSRFSIVPNIQCLLNVKCYYYWRRSHVPLLEQWSVITAGYLQWITSESSHTLAGDSGWWVVCGGGLWHCNGAAWGESCGRTVPCINCSGGHCHSAWDEGTQNSTHTCAHVKFPGFDAELYLCKTTGRSWVDGYLGHFCTILLTFYESIITSK